MTGEQHERAVEDIDLLRATAIMVSTLLDALPDDRREWLNELVERQGQAFPGAEKLQRASRAILQEVDAPMSVPVAEQGARLVDLAEVTASLRAMAVSSPIPAIAAKLREAATAIERRFGP